MFGLPVRRQHTVANCNMNNIETKSLSRVEVLNGNNELNTKCTHTFSKSFVKSHSEWHIVHCTHQKVHAFYNVDIRWYMLCVIWCACGMNDSFIIHRAFVTRAMDLSCVRIRISLVNRKNSKKKNRIGTNKNKNRKKKNNEMQFYVYLSLANRLTSCDRSKWWAADNESRLVPYSAIDIRFVSFFFFFLQWKSSTYSYILLTRHVWHAVLNSSQFSQFSTLGSFCFLWIFCFRSF